MSIPTAPPSGFRDFMPEQVALRQDAVAVITKVYKSFGFQPIATSAVEDLQVLTGKGGGENEKLIFKILKRGEALELGARDQLGDRLAVRDRREPVALAVDDDRRRGDPGEPLGVAPPAHRAPHTARTRSAPTPPACDAAPAR